MYSQYFGPLANQVNGLIFVKGVEGAMAYQLPPNSSMPLFDEDEELMYAKSTDGAGFQTIRTFRLEEVETEQAGPVTREEFSELMKKVDSLLDEEAKNDK